MVKNPPGAGRSGIKKAVSCRALLHMSGSDTWLDSFWSHMLSAETTSTIVCLFIDPQVCPLYFISPWIELLLQDHVWIHSALAKSLWWNDILASSAETTQRAVTSSQRPIWSVGCCLRYDSSRGGTTFFFFFLSFWRHKTLHAVLLVLQHFKCMTQV